MILVIIYYSSVSLIPLQISNNGIDNYALFYFDETVAGVACFDVQNWFFVLFFQIVNLSEKRQDISKLNPQVNN